MDHFYSIFTYTFASLFSMLNPIGMSALFLAMTKAYPAQQRYEMAYKVALYSGILLIAVLFLGLYVLKFFGISLSAIQIAGGMLVFYTAWNMLDTKPKISSKEQLIAAEHTDITFFPLTMPITAGAGAMAVTIALAAKLAIPNSIDIIGYISTICAIIVVVLMVAVCYRFSDYIFNKLGVTGTNVVTSLTAFVLLAIGINVIWEGVTGFITPLLH